ncbi:MAG: class I SAM-dependent methyltransferase [Gordonia sp. (in: high G+C Gram-positive bacteria)]|uniref:class I SAM-dependent methyltransferase n=1 Tax=Gordonia sp. (in: high G+C Gram-positive bacteria) TaxID=84139 RepID=UPI0039E51767
MSHDHGHAHHPHSAAAWDERYGSADRLWTAQANPALIREAAELTPGTALDVGSGEGADARWLADRGWHVTAVDISQVALDRAAAMDSRETIAWRRVDLTAEKVPSTGSGSGEVGSGSDEDRSGDGAGGSEGGAGYDLVSMHYFPVAIDRADVIAALVDALAPGGTLLVVAHDPEGIRAHGHDPDEYFQPADVAEKFADRLDVRRLAMVPRGRPAGGTAGRRHMDDVVLRATRR